jgi:hypothetical protein
MMALAGCGNSHSIRYVINFSVLTHCKPLFQITFLQQKIQLLYIPDVEEETVEEREHHRTRMAKHHYVHLLLMRKMVSYFFVMAKE